ncbi:MAG: BolA family transcriptional regulator [Gammaproteobacteria bacterium]|nr:BolA family transcriptional regulator [Gammaproteobacteria bacterium]
MSLEEAITQCLTTDLSPDFIEVDNESHLHSSGKGGNSHFKVTVVSDAFNGLSLVARHRKVQQVVAPVTGGVVHALGIHTYTPDEWKQRGYEIPESPTCAGSKHS